MQFLQVVHAKLCFMFPRVFASQLSSDKLKFSFNFTVAIWLSRFMVLSLMLLWGSQSKDQQKRYLYSICIYSLIVICLQGKKIQGAKFFSMIDKLGRDRTVRAFEQGNLQVSIWLFLKLSPLNTNVIPFVQ